MNIEKAIYKSHRNINFVESTKNKTLEPPDMPKGKTDLADQEKTKITPLKKVVSDRKIIIGANLSQEEESELMETLAKNKYIFS
jgi:hypothetical protein